MNLRLPYDSSTKNIVDAGLFYSCQIALDSLYTFTLKKITSNAIPIEWNSYYKTNAIFLGGNKKHKFKEKEKDTEYMYKGNYGKFVDIDNGLYEITLLLPTLGCALQH